LVVSGTARVEGAGERRYAFFVKAFQAWVRSPLSHHLPEWVRGTVAALLP
jgi:hypothetical protein